MTSAITTNPDPAMKMAADVPIIATISPAAAGAMIRVPCQTIELSATALIITLRSISWGYSACRAGWSKALTAPDRNASTTMCQTFTTSKNVRKPSRKISDAVASWQKKISFCLSRRSANTPPNRLSAMEVEALARLTMPSASAEPVSWYVSQPCANMSI